MRGIFCASITIILLLFVISFYYFIDQKSIGGTSNEIVSDGCTVHHILTTKYDSVIKIPLDKIFMKR